MKIGDKGPAVALLKQRLSVTGDLPSDAARGALFDDRVTAAVKLFQARHGLPETGLVGPRTVQAMNVPAEVRFRQLVQSALRVTGSKFPFSERYVVVNIPSAAVEAVQGGQVVRRYVAVVGKTDRPSPAVETRITSVNLNPTWTAPVSLIRKDIIPHMRQDPGYLAKMKIRILDAQGHEVEPTRIDWSTENAVNYTLRQDAGAANALGQIRIDMPNRHAVYMHDTPTKRLFSGGVRFQSSGCVRVADVKIFATWLLEGTPGPNGAAGASPISTPPSRAPSARTCSWRSLCRSPGSISRATPRRTVRFTFGMISTASMPQASRLWPPACRLGEVEQGGCGSGARASARGGPPR